MYKNRYIDETFDIDNSLNYILSIRFSSGGFSFCVLDNTINKAIVLSNHEFISATAYQLLNHIKQIFKQEEILQKNFKRVLVNYFDHRIAAIPISIVDKENYDSIFDLTFGKERFEEIESWQQNNAIKWLFAIPSTIKQFLEQHYQHLNWYPSIAPLLTHSVNAKNQHTDIIVYSHNQHAAIIAIQDDILMFSNCFYTKTNADLVFYLLHVKKQLSNASKIKLILNGDFDSSSDIAELLNNHFSNLEFSRYRTDKYTVSYTFTNVPEYKYLPLIEQSLCE